MAPLPSSMQACWKTGSPVQMRCTMSSGWAQGVVVLVLGSPLGSRPSSVSMYRKFACALSASSDELLCSGNTMSTSEKMG